MNIIKELKKAWDNALTSPEEKKATENAKQTLEELKAEILAASESNEPVLPEKVELPAAEPPEEMQRVGIDEDKLKEQAKSSLADYERQKSKGIEDKAEADKANVETRKKNAETAKDKELEELEAAYGAAKTRLDNDALKRGVARSSIAVAKNAELESGRAAGETAIGSEYLSALSELERLLGEIESGRISSLADLKADMETRIADKTASLKASAEKADREALEYNNKIRAQAAESEADRRKAEEALYEKTLANFQTEQKLKEKAEAKDAETRTKNMYVSNYNKMDEFLSSMNRSDAAKFLKDDPFFRTNLTDYLYYKLYDKYIR